MLVTMDEDQTPAARVELDPTDVGIDTVTVGWPEEGGPGDVLRRVSGDIMAWDVPEPEKVGTISAWVCWPPLWDDLTDAGDRIDDHAYRLGKIADDIVAANPDEEFESALFLELLFLEARFRGNKLTGSLVADLMTILRLDPDATVVVLFPGPVASPTVRMDDGPARDVALTKLRGAYRESGFRPWRRGGDGIFSGFWWLPPSHIAD